MNREKNNISCNRVSRGSGRLTPKYPKSGHPSPSNVPWPPPSQPGGGNRPALSRKGQPADRNDPNHPEITPHPELTAPQSDNGGDGEPSEDPQPDITVSPPAGGYRRRGGPVNPPLAAAGDDHCVEGTTASITDHYDRADGDSGGLPVIDASDDGVAVKGASAPVPASGGATLIGASAREARGAQGNAESSPPAGEASSPSRWEAASPPDQASLWPSTCLAREQEFGSCSSRLYPLIGKTVWTPQGPGKLVDVKDKASVAFPQNPETTVPIPIEQVLPVDPESLGMSFEEARKACWEDPQPNVEPEPFHTEEERESIRQRIRAAVQRVQEREANGMEIGLDDDCQLVWKRKDGPPSTPESP